MVRLLCAFARRLMGTHHAPSNPWEQYRDYIKVHPSAVIAPCATLTIFNPPSPPRICLEIGEGSHVFSSFALLRPEATIRIGRNCQLGASQFIAAQLIEIEDDVIMAWGITVIDSDNHSIYWSERQYDVARCRDDYARTGGKDMARSHDWRTVGVSPVVIGAKAWIGFNSLILKGVNIGEGAIVGAGSVVRRNLKKWHIAMGNPCVEVRPISESEKSASN